MDESLISLVSRTISTSGGIEKAVFLLLAAFSLVSWSIIFFKICTIYAVRKNTAKFLACFDEAQNLGSIASAGAALGHSPHFSVLKSALRALEGQSSQKNVPTLTSDPREIRLRSEGLAVERVLLQMQNTARLELNPLERGLGFLATIGSTSPFIGLFGTVWGIMNTFRDLGNATSASLQVVAPGISSALIATAAGLAVAIPAVMAYNLFLSQIDLLQDSADTFVEHMSLIIRASKVAGPDLNSEQTGTEFVVKNERSQSVAAKPNQVLQS